MACECQDAELLKARIQVFEHSLGVLLRCSLEHVEAVQTTDLPLLVAHCAAVLRHCAAMPPAEPEWERLQEAAVLRYSLTTAILTMATLTTAALTMAILTTAMLTMAPPTAAPPTTALHTMAVLTRYLACVMLRVDPNPHPNPNPNPNPNQVPRRRDATCRASGRGPSHAAAQAGCAS